MCGHALAPLTQLVGQCPKWQPVLTTLTASSRCCGPESRRGHLDALYAAMTLAYSQAWAPVLVSRVTPHRSTHPKRRADYAAVTQLQKLHRWLYTAECSVQNATHHAATMWLELGTPLLQGAEPLYKKAITLAKTTGMTLPPWCPGTSSADTAQWHILRLPVHLDVSVITSERKPPPIAKLPS